MGFAIFLFGALNFAEASGCSDLLLESRLNVGDSVFHQFGQGSAIRFKGRDYVLTPAHVIQGADSVEARCLDGRGGKFTLKLVGASTPEDVALLVAPKQVKLEGVIDLGRSEHVCDSDVVFNLKLSFLKIVGQELRNEELKIPYGFFAERHLNQPLMGLDRGLLISSVSARPGWSGARVMDEDGRFCGMVVRSSRRFAYSYGVPARLIAKTVAAIVKSFMTPPNARVNSIGGNRILPVFEFDRGHHRVLRLRARTLGEKFYLETSPASEYIPVSDWNLSHLAEGLERPIIKDLKSDLEKLKIVGEALHRNTSAMDVSSNVLVMARGPGDWGDGGGDLSGSEQENSHVVLKKSDGTEISVAYLSPTEASAQTQGLLESTGRRLVGLKAIPFEVLKKWAVPEFLRKIGDEWKVAHDSYRSVNRIYAIEQIFQIEADFGLNAAKIIERFGIFEDTRSTVKALCQGGGLNLDQLARTMKIEDLTNARGEKLSVALGRVRLKTRTSYDEKRALESEKLNWLGSRCESEESLLHLRLNRALSDETRVSNHQAGLVMDLTLTDASIKGSLVFGECRMDINQAKTSAWAALVSSKELSFILNLNEDDARPFSVEFLRADDKCLKGFLENEPGVARSIPADAKLWLRRFEWTR